MAKTDTSDTCLGSRIVRHMTGADGGSSGHSATLAKGLPPHGGRGWIGTLLRSRSFASHREGEVREIHVVFPNHDGGSRPCPRRRARMCAAHHCRLPDRAKNCVDAGTPGVVGGGGCAGRAGRAPRRRRVARHGNRCLRRGTDGSRTRRGRRIAVHPDRPQGAFDGGPGQRFGVAVRPCPSSLGRAVQARAGRMIVSTSLFRTMGP